MKTPRSFLHSAKAGTVLGKFRKKCKKHLQSSPKHDMVCTIKNASGILHQIKIIL